MVGQKAGRIIKHAGEDELNPPHKHPPVSFSHCRSLYSALCKLSYGVAWPAAVTCVTQRTHGPLGREQRALRGPPWTTIVPLGVCRVVRSGFGTKKKA